MFAGGTFREVPATINKSEYLIFQAALVNKSMLRGSLYSTTSGFITPPQLHLGMPFELNIASGEYFFYNLYSG